MLSAPSASAPWTRPTAPPVVPTASPVREGVRIIPDSRCWKPPVPRGAWGLQIGAASWTLRHRWRRRQRDKGVYVHAVVKGDKNAVAVKRWFDKLIVGQDFCPWARVAAEQGQVRIVTSTATDPDGVFDDLSAEAGTLSRTDATPPPGTPTTTMLVCPYVEVWEQHFPVFWAFHHWTLQNGDVFERFGVTVSSSHPKYAFESQFVFSNGDRIVIPSPDGLAYPGKVLNDYSGEDPDGKTYFEIELEGGKKLELPHSAAMARPSPPPGAAPRSDDKDYLFAVFRSPRPMFHLLRVGDADKAQAESSKTIDEFKDANQEKAQRIGSKKFQEFLRRCG